MQTLWNGTRFEEVHSNLEGTAVASAARTATGNGDDITVQNAHRGAFFLDVTAASGTSPSLTVTVEAKDPVSGKYFTIGSFAAKTTTGTEAIFVGGGSDAEFVTRTFRVSWTISGTTPSFTFSVGYALVV